MSRNIFFTLASIYVLIVYMFMVQPKKEEIKEIYIRSSLIEQIYEVFNE